MTAAPGLRFYRALLRLHPKSFRQEYGDDMALLFAEQLRDGNTSLVWWRGLLDLAIAVPTRHLEAHVHRPPANTVPVLFAAVATAGILAVGIGGSNTATASVGFAVAVVAGLLAFAARRRTRDVTAPMAGSDNWWRFLAGGIGGIAVFAVTTTSVGELSAGGWVAGMVFLLTAVVLTCVGVVLGVARLARPRQA